MDSQIAHPSPAELWDLARRQHGVVSRAQLLELGLHPGAIVHRLKTGRLHPAGWGIYAVGRPELSRHGQWTAAVMSCGSTAVLSHESAAALWGIRSHEGAAIEVTIPPHLRRRRAGLTVYRRTLTSDESATTQGVAVTTIHRTLLDLSQTLERSQLETAINAADKYDLISPEALRAKLDDHAGRRGVVALCELLDRRTFTLTDSHLERLFLPITRRAGLEKPETGHRLNGFKVDFCWPELGLIVETDGLRYHRTPAQQTRDRLRDQAHTAAGLTTLRFTHAQVRYKPHHVQATLTAVADRLRMAR